MVTPATEQVSLADAKARLSEVVEGIETEHRRVVITKHGRPSVVVLAVEDLEALEDTLELLSDADAMADLREAAAARRTDQTIELTKEEGSSPESWCTNRRLRRSSHQPKLTTQCRSTLQHVYQTMSSITRPRFS